MAEALLSASQQEQIAKTILAVACKDTNKYEKLDIDLCLEILNKIRSEKHNDHKMGTAKLSAKLHKAKVSHNEADLQAIANLLRI